MDRTVVLLRPDVHDGDAFDGLWASFRRHLKAENRSPNTLESYDVTARQFKDWLLSQGLPPDPIQVTRGQIEGFIADLLETKSGATARTRFVALQSFFSWLVEEGELERSPMERMSAPKVADRPPDVITAEELRRLFKACEGKTYDDRRDTAILRLLLDTGLRRKELAGLRLEDVDLDRQLLRVRVKGGDYEDAPFGAKAARDLDRFLRLRAAHPHSSLQAVFVGPKGPLTASGVYQMLVRRAQEAGIDVRSPSGRRKVRPHALRHTFADALKAEGASDEDVMTLGRWRDPAVMRRYGRVRRFERARETHRRLSPGDRI